MSWILFSILAALVWAVVNISDKCVLVKWVKKPIVPVMVVGIIGLLASVVVYFIRGFSSLSFLNIVLAFITGVFYVLAVFFYFKAAKIEDISRVVSLFNLTPFFILILAALFLRESFPSEKYLGIFLLVIGAVIISSKNILRLKLRRAFWLIIVSNIGFAISMVLTKYLLNFADYWTIFSYTRIGTFFALLPIFYINFSDLIFTIKEKGRKTIAVMSLNESLNLAALLFLTIAASVGSITLVTALASLQPFFVLVFAVSLSIFYPKILKEELSKSIILQKFVAIVMMIIGVVLIT